MHAYKETHTCIAKSCEILALKRINHRDRMQKKKGKALHMIHKH